MRHRRAIVVGFVALVLAGLFALWRVGARMGEPEISNIGDLTDAKIPEDPALFVSDSDLLTPSPHKVQDRVVKEGMGDGLPGAPYFIDFGDGRFAFGHSDDRGYTGAFFTRAAQEHQTFWYDDALIKWDARARGAQDAKGR